MAANLLTVAAKSIAGPQSPVTKTVRRLPTTFTNVSSVERLLSLGVGFGLMTYGATRERTSPLALVAGGLLAYRGLTGHCGCYQALGVRTADATATARGRTPQSPSGPPPATPTCCGGTSRTCRGSCLTW